MISDTEYKTRKSVTYGVGFCDLLAIAFIVLKLTGVINWSWGWVLSPLWIPAVIFILLAVIAFVIGVICEAHEKTTK